MKSGEGNKERRKRLLVLSLSLALLSQPPFRLFRFASPLHASPNSAARISGSFCAYAMARRASSVLEQEMRPSGVRARTPPAL
jgi:hypothetical protein